MAHVLGSRAAASPPCLASDRELVQNFPPVSTSSWETHARMTWQTTSPIVVEIQPTPGKLFLSVSRRRKIPMLWTLFSVASENQDNSNTSDLAVDLALVDCLGDREMDVANEDEARRDARSEANDPSEAPTGRSARERRKLRNARRSDNQAVLEQKRSEQQDRLVAEMNAPKRRERMKKREKDRNALMKLGMQWYMLTVNRSSELLAKVDVAEALSANFPEMAFELFIPVYSSGKLNKSGSLVTTEVRLHAGRIFLKCTMSDEVFDFITRLERVQRIHCRLVGHGSDISLVPVPTPEKDVEAMKMKCAEFEALYEQLKQEVEKRESKANTGDVGESEEGLEVPLDSDAKA
eukprot:TRINITY_DN1893_c0_g1_i1.p1 TRINITY_DN1893_c0_g1~~TRINITY_DN1893_c0_g1_i1.p1  ORF type:complete len:350 (-),score=83.25 TRINITY_DN1893_c0_g1_i1:114-1163(-)